MGKFRSTSLTGEIEVQFRDKKKKKKKLDCGRYKIVYFLFRIFSVPFWAAIILGFCLWSAAEGQDGVCNAMQSEGN